ncbi:TPA: hypothetical protein ACRMDF_002743 [Pseudomonas aeruginosa]|uniref:hypothetical protein n=3 Tax=Pseudomonas aeruginosa TaxID=287 RepID=UPI00033A1E45|nr:hypothetical protein [Pseudomonas aeruginosa]EIY2513865.1 hypothetical protein [Pseudomonas aeruginosa]EIY2821660.1 hypothetical protein [Pseudomonas aeruginosa]EKT7989938.1 hypothetical protein [Pseudomonas aeruginosa]EKU2959038.1 hypothetical protein [Pseudomonas aeruginosa]EKV8083801.1 hypothetical protein [Pseudomonas aeruginosa]
MAEALSTQAHVKSAAATKRKRAGRPIYLEFKRMVDPDTGEVRLALVADSGIDKFLLKERGYRAGAKVRAELKQPRDVRKHRLVHRLGQLVARNVDGFQGMDAHSVIKKLQGDAGVCCSSEYFDLGGLGRVSRLVPESLAFDEMPEERFLEFWRGICQHLIEHYWTGMSEEQIGDMINMMPEEVV